MADVKVHFMHPTDSRILTVTLDNTMTDTEVLGELIANDFMPPHDQGYRLAIKGGDEIQPNHSLAQASVRDGDTLRVIPMTEAGQAGIGLSL